MATFNGTSASELITGGAGPDVLNGEGGNDTLSGGAGEDTLNGGDGNDRLIIDIGEFTVLDGGSGIDTAVIAAAFSDTGLDVNGANIDGSGALWTLFGTDFSADGVERLEFQDITFQLLVGSGSLASNSAFASIIVGSVGSNDLFGSIQDDIFFSLDGFSDEIIGGGGADIFACSYLAADELDGDYIDDFGADDLILLTGYQLDSTHVEFQLVGPSHAPIGLDILIDADDNGFADAVVSLGGNFGAVIDDFRVEIRGADTVILFGPGSISGTNAANTLNGTIRGDLMFGLGGADQMNGGVGKDTIDGGGGDDTLNGGAGADSLEGYGGRDSMLGGDGDDFLHGYGSHDSLYGGNGNDDLRGGFGRDLLGGSGNNDVLRGFEGEDRLFGGAGNDTLLGNDDNDSLTGGGGSDRLKGDAGDDSLNGNFGADTVTGGAGDDVFEFRKTHGADVYDDFVAGAGTDDAIRLIAFGAAFDTFAEVIAAASDNGTHTTIDFGGGDTITLLNVVVGDLHEGDFIFG